MKRIYKEWLVIIRTIEYFRFALKYDKSLRGALKLTFRRKDNIYRIDGGPWVNGSSYDRIREMSGFKRRG